MILITQTVTSVYLGNDRAFNFKTFHVGFFVYAPGGQMTANALAIDFILIPQPPQSSLN